jgi:hypothetical protein
MGFGTDDRDRGFRRISTVTKWLAAGAVGLVGVFSAWAAGAIPGRNGAAATPSTSDGASSANTSADGATATTQAPSSSADNLQQPAQAPVPTPARHRARSGGS